MHGEVKVGTLAGIFAPGGSFSRRVHCRSVTTPNRMALVRALTGAGVAWLEVGGSIDVRFVLEVP